MSVLAIPTIAGSVSVNDRACGSLVIQPDRGTYTLGESVNITVNFAPLLPGCAELMIAHDYVIKIQILNSSNNEQYSSTHVTTGPLTIHEVWTPVEKGNYTIKASSWLRLAGGNSLVKGLEASRTILVQDPGQSMMPETIPIALGVIGVLAVTLAYLFFKHVTRKRQAT